MSGRIALMVAILAVSLLASTASGISSVEAAKAFKLTSPAFGQNQSIPVKHTCDGAGRSPKLTWVNPPQGTRSFALIMDDPDAPGGTFTHWTGWNLRASARSLAAGRALPREGLNSVGQAGYLGPCPPPGDGPHRYRFKLYALDVVLGLSAGATRAQLLAAIAGHVLKQSTLTGTYER